MKKILVIGIGAGNPDYLTVQAINALNEVDVFFVIDKGKQKEDLGRLRKEICRRFIKDQDYRLFEVPDPERDRSPASYATEIAAWREKRVALYRSMISEELKDGECGAFLIWGDPSLYDGTLGILQQILAQGTVEFEYEVIPGITSVQALAARHKISLNRTGESIHITPARKLADGLPAACDNVVVMLDAGTAFNSLADDDLDIYWGAYLGTDDEILASGKVREVGKKIADLRSARKTEKGWIMDTYLLRRGLATE
jgi:precorrin-6A synthase